MEPQAKTVDIEQFKTLYQSFNTKTLEQLPLLYCESILFKDPVHQITGLAMLKRYFEIFYNPKHPVAFTFTNQLITEDQAFFQWQMHYSHAKLNSGAPLRLNGGTLIKFTHLIHYHEDFYDMGAMIYQHVPVLGWAIKTINQRITEGGK
jgi:hypothetical protein